MNLEELQQLAAWDPQLKKHIEMLTLKTNQEQRGLVGRVESSQNRR
jgi:hypothetical protein